MYNITCTYILEVELSIHFYLHASVLPCEVNTRTLALRKLWTKRLNEFLNESFEWNNEFYDFYPPSHLKFNTSCMRAPKLHTALRGNYQRETTTLLYAHVDANLQYQLYCETAVTWKVSLNE